MRIEIEVPPDPRRLGRIVKAVHGRRIVMMQALGALGVVAAVLLLMTIPFQPAVVGVLVGGVVLVAYPLLAARGAGNRRIVNGEWRYTIDESGLVAQGPSITSSFPWGTFREARVTATDVILFVDKGTVLAIPRDRIPPDTHEKLTLLLAAHGLLEARR